MWSPQQDAAFKPIRNWFNEYHLKHGKGVQQVFYLAGYAGTGKTTLAKHFAEDIGGEVLFGAFTGKASLVLRQKGCMGARTIHSMIYTADVDKKTGEVHFRLNRSTSPLNDVKLAIIDECSMVDTALAQDLLSFRIPILVLGDPAQLPPVSGAGFFTQRKPDIMLTEIHRQAKDNPIIYLATQAREGIFPDFGDYGESRVISKASSKDALEADMILVGRNITRTDMNRKMRKLLKMDSDLPIAGDKLICLKNDKDLGIFNGGMFTVDHESENPYKNNFIRLCLQSDDEEAPPRFVRIHKSFFVDEVKKPDWKMLKGSQEFDFGYAITTHKSQGSQADNVLIYDESFCFRDDWQKWLYTAITRAAQKLTLVKG